LSRITPQMFVYSNYGDALDAAKTMCRELSRVAEKPCRPPPPKPV
jgi:hypothetical protein